MYSKSIISFLILSLLTLTKINGDGISNYTGKCNDIYNYLESQGKANNFYDCKMNNKGEVIEVRVYPYCLENKQLDKILSYKTIETLEFTRPLTDDYYLNYDLIKSHFDCDSVPTNYELLSTLINLKYLDLVGATNMNINVITQIPKSIEVLKIGENYPSYMTLTQKMIDVMSKFTNLKSLTLEEVGIPEELDFKNFENLKNLTSLEIYFDEESGFDHSITGNMLKYFKYLKKLVISIAGFYEGSFEAISNISQLEELELGMYMYEDESSFSSINKLKNLTSLSLDCYYDFYHDCTISKIF